MALWLVVTGMGSVVQKFLQADERESDGRGRDIYQPVIFEDVRFPIHCQTCVTNR